MRKTAGLLASVAILASALLGAPSAQAAAGDLTAGGSSFAGGILRNCAASYATAFPAQGSVTYTANSSSTGKTNFAAGTYDFGATDFAYTGTNGDNKPANAKYIPVTSGPIAIIYNLAGITGLKITPEILAKIYKGQITTWNDTEIKSIQNLGIQKQLQALANKNITPAYRAAGSGTSDNLAGYLHQVTNNFTQSSDWSVATGVGTPRGNSYSSGGNLKTGVLATAGSIGYVDLKDALTGVQIALLRNEAGQYYAADAKRANTFLSQQTSIAADGNVNIDWTKSISGGYNASLFTYAVVNTNPSTKVTVSVKGANVKKFLGYVLSTCGPAVSYNLGYTPIQGAVRTKALALVNYIK